jgi:hypothetical protein
MASVNDICARCDAPLTRVGRKYCSRLCAGKSSKGGKAAKPLVDRYEKHVVRRGAGACWGWSGFKHKGYGRLRVGSSAVGAHRVSWLLNKGPIPSGLTVLHRCDNPECTNPAHLFLGTNVDNNLDRNAKGRQARGERASTAKLTEARVREIRASSPADFNDLAARFSVSRTTIRFAHSGRTWSHVA